MGKFRDFKHTLYACYIGYLVQAGVLAFISLLFLQFRRELGLSLAQVGLIPSVNFATQLITDICIPKLADKFGYRRCLMFGHIMVAIGMIISTLAKNFGVLMIAVIIFSIGLALIDMLSSPLVESCPTDAKEAAMSLLHSFYCWGFAATVLLSTLFFKLCGLDNWRTISFIIAGIAIINSIYFFFVPIYPIVKEGKGVRNPFELLRNKTFILLLLVLMCGGIAEHCIGQWSSSFAEAGLGVSKAIGDIAGPCAFAIMMAISRTIYSKNADRLPLKKTLFVYAIGCTVCFLIAALSPWPALSLIGCALSGFFVAMFWPGGLSLAAAEIPTGGTLMFAMLSLFGDVGCSVGPALVGIVASSCGDNIRIGILTATVFPIALIVTLWLLSKNKTN